MKWLSVFLLGAWLTCGVRSGNIEQFPPNDTNKISADSLGEQVIQTDTNLLQFSNQVLSDIKNSGHSVLTDIIHPEEGIRFSPYGYIDTVSDIHFSLHNYIEAVKEINPDKEYTWGEFDGSGEPIKMTLGKYFKRFVYDADFINAPVISINECKAGGNSLNNIFKVYGSHEFVEYYFPGFDPKYDGMDWKALRLVFKKSGGKYRLVAIIHDEWTI